MTRLMSVNTVTV